MHGLWCRVPSELNFMQKTYCHRYWVEGVIISLMLAFCYQYLYNSIDFFVQKSYFDNKTKTLKPSDKELHIGLAYPAFKFNFSNRETPVTAGYYILLYEQQKTTTKRTWSRRKMSQQSFIFMFINYLLV